ncbi:hypothetical protein [Anaerorhabdus sp.]|uniref:hypothetical protein n=1 Tax=Anaerorhabdus sp. TaxID=1872524 RepID=UPI002FCA4255
MKKEVTNLEAFKENARQCNQAIIDAEKASASILEFRDITGKLFKFYWNGASFVEKSSALYENERNGVYYAEFIKPSYWM